MGKKFRRKKLKNVVETAAATALKEELEEAGGATTTPSAEHPDWVQLCLEFVFWGIFALPSFLMLISDPDG